VLGLFRRSRISWQAVLFRADSQDGMGSFRGYQTDPEGDRLPVSFALEMCNGYHVLGLSYHGKHERWTQSTQVSHEERVVFPEKAIGLVGRSGLQRRGHQLPHNGHSLRRWLPGRCSIL
jgi:hypothetical protein